jgi:hypothetical protein
LLLALRAFPPATAPLPAQTQLFGLGGNFERRAGAAEKSAVSCNVAPYSTQHFKSTIAISVQGAPFIDVRRELHGPALT